LRSFENEKLCLEKIYIEELHNSYFTRNMIVMVKVQEYEIRGLFNIWGAEKCVKIIARQI
jgi:hypothetical protein